MQNTDFEAPKYKQKLCIHYYIHEQKHYTNLLAPKPTPDTDL